MLSKFLKIALRNLVRNKVTSVINLAGLTIGITVVILVLLYVSGELSYEEFHKNNGNIYRVGLEISSPTGYSKISQTAYPFYDLIKDVFPEIKNITRVFFSGDNTFEFNNNRFFENRLLFADESFFEIFSFNLTEGNRSDVLKAPYSIVLTKSSAKKYFGNVNPVGKQIKINNRKYFTVTGVTEDPPVNTEIHFEFIASYSSVTEEYMGFNVDNWGAFFGNYTFLLLRKNSDKKEIEDKINEFMLSKAPARRGNDIKMTYLLQPLNETHTDDSFTKNPEEPVNMANIRIVVIAGSFLLIIALINFINLTVANSLTRFKEIGIRKLNGAGKFQLVLQFAAESCLFLTTALAAAILITESYSGYIFSLFEVETSKTALTEPSILQLLFGIIILSSFIAGAYPAYLLGKPPVTSILKGIKPVEGIHKFGIKKGLVVLQFAIAVIFIAANLVVESQLEFMQSGSLGFDDKNVMQINIPSSKNDRAFPLKTFKTSLAGIPGIINVTSTFGSPYGTTVYASITENASGAEHEVMINYTEENYPEFFGMRLLAGRFFQKNSSAENGMVINETLMKKLGYSEPEEVVGKSLFKFWDMKGQIIGVINDFHVASFRETIPPVLLVSSPKKFTSLFIRLNPSNIPGTIAGIKHKWEELYPESPLTYSFADETIKNLYSKEKKQADIVFAISVIAVAIAGMGLFGLSSITVSQRVKEIGIRKVNGATSREIVFLLSKEAVKLILIANIIALPIAYYYLNTWLENFAYRIEPGFLLFLTVSVISFLTGFISVSSQALKASLADPVKSLRYE